MGIPGGLVFMFVCLFVLSASTPRSRVTLPRAQYDGSGRKAFFWQYTRHSSLQPRLTPGPSSKMSLTILRSATVLYLAHLAAAVSVRGFGGARALIFRHSVRQSPRSLLYSRAGTRLKLAICLYSWCMLTVVVVVQRTFMQVL